MIVGQRGTSRFVTHESKSQDFASLFAHCKLHQVGSLASKLGERQIRPNLALQMTLLHGGTDCRADDGVGVYRSLVGVPKVW